MMRKKMNADFRAKTQESRIVVGVVVVVVVALRRCERNDRGLPRAIVSRRGIVFPRYFLRRRLLLFLKRN